MKKIILVLLSIFGLVGCHNYQNTIDKFDMEAYKNDIYKFRIPDLSDIKDAPYKINTFIYQEENEYVYTIQIEYDGLRLNSLRVIMSPFTDNDDITWPNIGYSSNLNLSEVNNTTDNDYKGYNLSYKTEKKDLSFYLFVSYNNGEYVDDVYWIDTFKKVG
ncbi:MAG: hypothetical protein E7180_00690 [Erysipelotrichaceae bacterium]|nr:hypothetical protein [Erysipelotrichaceae bacterium]